MIIAISGLAGSGKDTIADYLVNKYGFVKVSLADPLKRICKDIFDFSKEQLWGPSENRNKLDSRYPNLAPRKALQKLGTEFARDCYEDVWVDYGLRVADKLSKGSGYIYSAESGLTRLPPSCVVLKQNVVINDCRFSNEVNKFKSIGAFLIRVVRSSAGLKGKESLHPSEQEQLSIPDSEFNIVIQNNESIEDLYYKLDLIISLNMDKTAYIQNDEGQVNC